MKLKVFVASPGDVIEERDIVSFVVDELRRTMGVIRNVELEVVRWETHAWPDVGEDAQAVINEQIGAYDVIIGIMWKRFGTSTKRALSGTEEEFQRAYDYFTSYGRPRIMFYFRTAPFYTTDPKELSQFQKVISFREKLQKLGVLFWEYNQPIDFERALREHLIHQILEQTEPKIKSKPEAEIEPMPKSIAPPTPFVFISSCREDTNRASTIYRALAAAGFQPWLDVEDLMPGQNWRSAIKEAINRSDYFLALLSKFSVTKRGFVNEELRIALDESLRRPVDTPYIIPVRLEDVSLPPTLNEYQWLELFKNQDIDKLISSLKSISGITVNNSNSLANQANSAEENDRAAD